MTTTPFQPQNQYKAILLHLQKICSYIQLGFFELKSRKFCFKIIFSKYFLLSQGFLFNFFSKSYKYTLLRQIFFILSLFKLNFNDSLTDPTLLLCSTFSFCLLIIFYNIVDQRFQKSNPQEKTTPIFWH